MPGCNPDLAAELIYVPAILARSSAYARAGREGGKGALRHVAGCGISLMQMGNANFNPWTEAKVNTKNPDRGPLLIIEGEQDRTVPWAIANASAQDQVNYHNPGFREQLMKAARSVP
jgi:hypothetical protein